MTLIKKLVNEHNQVVQYTEESQYKDGFLAGMRMAIDIAKKDNGWISVDDELPPNSGDFWLVYTDKGRIAECRYYSDEWIATYCNNERVTHWQPLPQPPKE